MPWKAQVHRRAWYDAAKAKWDEADRRRYEAQPQRRADRAFYCSTRWRKFRALVLGCRPLCEDCLAHGRTEPGKHVHHLKERRDFPDLAFDEGNVQVLCQPCHSRVTMTETRRRQSGRRR